MSSSRTAGYQGPLQGPYEHRKPGLNRDALLSALVLGLAGWLAIAAVVYVVIELA